MIEWRIIPVIAVVLVALLAGCRQPSGKGGGEPAVVQRLRADWESRLDRGASKNAWSAAASEWRRVFRREIEAGHLDEIYRFVLGQGEEPVERQADLMIQSAMFYELLDRPDRTRLRDLLAAVPVDFGSYGSVEETLERTEEMKDGLGVVFEAFDAAVSPKMRETNYLIVWRALGEAPGDSSDQRAYVQRARAWYASNRGRLRISDQYDWMDLMAVRDGTLSGMEPRHLLVLKDP